MRSKRYLDIKKNIDRTKLYPVKDALEIVKKNSNAKFDERVDLAIRIGLKRQKEQFVIRGNVEIPFLKAKEKKIVAIINDDEAAQIKDLKKAGASIVGGQKIIAKIAKDGKLDADMVVADPSMMPALAKVARIIGPKGLMPSPKTGTISKDLVALVNKFKKGNQIEIRGDKTGNIHTVIGNVSQKAEELIKNFESVFNFVKKQKPEDWKGDFIIKVVISSTMGPGIKVDAK
jgi:large subunit ribosomal protein L1